MSDSGTCACFALEVIEYLLRGGNELDPWPYTQDITLRRFEQLDGSYKWAILRDSWVFNKHGDWEIQPMPSSRDKGFLERCRWDTAQEAYQFWKDRGGD